ncbi:MAG TPA: DUF922 domain-containing protein [bacterium]
MEKKQGRICTHIVLTVLLGACSLLLSGDDEYIYWQEQRELHWTDFRKTPPSNHRFSAQSWVGLDVDGHCVEGRFYYDVTAFFNRDSSWVNRKRLGDKLLRHEQGHFDIAEIAARQLRKELQELGETCNDVEKMKKTVNRLTTFNRMKLNMEQSDYDTETRNGGDSKKQKQWQEKMGHRLQQLESYQE